MRRRHGRGQSEVVGALIMVAASVVFTTIIMFWGLSTQGQGLTNYGSAIARVNSQAAEQISIDEVLFDSANNRIRVYPRNFGDQVVRISAFYVIDPQTGLALVTCEVQTGSGVVTPRTATPKTLPTNCSSTKGTINIGGWQGRTVTIRIATDAGTIFEDNFRVP